MKRVLIVFNSFYNPGMARNRLLRLVRHLPRHGYEPTLLTEVCRQPGQRDAAPAATVLQVPALDLPHLYARLRGKREANPLATAGEQKPRSRSIGFSAWVNRWFMVPDKCIPWAAPAVRAALKHAAQAPYDLVFASVLPATNGIVGARIAEALDVPLAVEYRDLWTGNPYHNLAQPTVLHRALHARAERHLLRRAARVACLSTGIAQRLSELYASDLRQPPRVQYNFFDPDEFAAAGPPPEKPAAFTISYVGTMYLTRQPAMFFKGLRLFIDRHRLTPDQLRFRWLGFIVGIAGLEQMIAEAGVSPYLDFLGQIAHRDALNELRRSHASLIIQSPDDTIHIPGKMFEAMGARVPLLAIANPCEVTRLIDRTQAGVHCPYEPEAVAQALERLWVQSRSGAAWPFQDQEIQRFSVDEAVGDFARLLDEALASA